MCRTSSCLLTCCGIVTLSVGCGEGGVCADAGGLLLPMMVWPPLLAVSPGLTVAAGIASAPGVPSTFWSPGTTYETMAVAAGLRPTVPGTVAAAAAAAVELTEEPDDPAPPTAIAAEPLLPPPPPDGPSAPDSPLTPPPPLLPSPAPPAALPSFLGLCGPAVSCGVLADGSMRTMIAILSDTFPGGQGPDSGAHVYEDALFCQTDSPEVDGVTILLGVAVVIGSQTRHRRHDREALIAPWSITYITQHI
uniref:Uncharacterized protein n=1 Tax=Anopheles atroparvus TaxID=41427 RepID=A0A182J3S2_ANOAO